MSVILRQIVTIMFQNLQHILFDLQNSYVSENLSAYCILIDYISP